MNILFVKIKRKFLRRTLTGICLNAVIGLLFFLPALAENDCILAEVGDNKITLRELENKISRTRERNSDASFAPDKEKLLLEMVKLEVFAMEAMAIGLENDKEVQARITKLHDKLATEALTQKENKEDQTLIRVARNYVLATEYIYKKMEEEVSIDEKEILLYYEENRSDYIQPAMIRARQIYIKANQETDSKINIDAARKNAERILKRLNNGEEFSTLAKEFSEDPLSMNKGGDMGYFPRGRLVPELEEPVFQLKQDQISPVLTTKGGFHIFKLEDRTEKRQLEYDEVRDRIIKKLKPKKQQEWLIALEEELFKKYKVKIYKDRIPQALSS